MYKAIPIEDYYIIVSNSINDCDYGNLIVDIDDPNKVFTLSGLPDDGYRRVLFQSNPVHEGIPLFDAPWEVDVEELAYEYAEKHAFRVPYNGSNKFYDEKDYKSSEEGFKAGYLKRAETYKWTDEDMMYLLQYIAREFFKRGREYKGNMAIAGDPLHGLYNELKGYLQSLQKPKCYEIELEMIGKELLTNNCINCGVKAITEKQHQHFCNNCGKQFHRIIPEPKIINNKVIIKSYKYENNN